MNKCIRINLLFPMIRNALFSLLLLLTVCSCSAQQAPVSVIHFSGKVVLLLDSAQAAQTIVQDPYDRFFELVNPVEMSIQMKKPLSGQDDRLKMVADYQAFLRTDVEGFSATESQFVEKIMRDIYTNCEAISPAICPDTLVLIKTKGQHYGDGVYYTRANCIVIPADALRARNRTAFSSTMYHELFHVYSRLNPDKRTALYRLIGFESVGLPNLHLPEPLASRVLYNPDGVDYAQKITLKMDDGRTIYAVPVIYANHQGFTDKQPSFFSYLQFSLFPIEAQEDGHWKLVTKADGLSSTLNVSNLPDFYRQIKDNTGYIIHPDEVLADNFAFLMQSKSNSAVTSRFSPGGKQLLADMEKIIRQ